MAKDGSYQITHLIFDMDGLLLDTEKFYTIAQQKVLDPFRKTFTFDVKVIIDEFGLQDQISAETFLTQRDDILKELFTKSAPLPGVERLVEHLHRHNVPIAVGTSSIKATYDIKTAHLQHLFSKFNHVVTGERVSRSKPAPDIFHKAAALFEPAPAPEHVLVLEDAPAGVVAARAAGMRTCMVPDPSLDPELTKAADVVLTSLEEFVPEHFGLPAFE